MDSPVELRPLPPRPAAPPGVRRPRAARWSGWRGAASGSPVSRGTAPSPFLHDGEPGRPRKGMSRFPPPLGPSPAPGVAASASQQHCQTDRRWPRPGSVPGGVPSTSRRPGERKVAPGLPGAAAEDARQRAGRHRADELGLDVAGHPAPREVPRAAKASVTAGFRAESAPVVTRALSGGPLTVPSWTPTFPAARNSRRRSGPPEQVTTTYEAATASNHASPPSSSCRPMLAPARPVVSDS
jgi:hypothetical protein